MGKKLKKTCFLAWLSLFLSLTAVLWADETVLPPARAAMPLDNAGGGARAMAMGSAFVGVADDASAILWNPAGLGGIPAAEFSIHHNSWLVDTYQEIAVLAFPLEPIGGLGFAFSYTDYGSFEGRDLTGSLNGSYGAGDAAAVLGWGKEWWHGIMLGGGLRLSQQFLPDKANSSVSLDAGALWQATPDVRLGASYANLGFNVGGSFKASGLRLGGSYVMLYEDTNRLLLAASGQVQPVGVNRIDLGAEDVLLSLFAFRAGYTQNLMDNELQGITGMSLGVGFLFHNISFDYAYLPFGDLGTSQRISLDYKFGSFEAAGPAHPAEVTNYYNLGQESEAKGDTLKALQAYNSAVKQDPKDYRSWRALGRLHYGLGERQDAIRCLDEYLNLRPDDVRMMEWLEKYKKESSQ